MSIVNKGRKKGDVMNNNHQRTTEHFYLKTFLFVLAGAIMIGHGARMMYQGLFQPLSYYPAPTPNTIDFYFDWLTLAILGLFIVLYSIHTFYRYRVKTKQTIYPIE